VQEVQAQGAVKIEMEAGTEAFPASAVSQSESGLPLKESESPEA
jgi:hypothetical protein